RIGFGSRRMKEMTGGQGGARHPRCGTMDALLDRTRGRTDLGAMRANFGDAARGLCGGKATIDLRGVDTTPPNPPLPPAPAPSASGAAPPTASRGGSTASRERGSDGPRDARDRKADPPDHE